MKINKNLEGKERQGKPSRGPVQDCKVVHVEDLVSTAGTTDSEWLPGVSSDRADKI